MNRRHIKLTYLLTAPEPAWGTGWSGKERKGKERKQVYLYSAIYCDTLKALRRG